MTDTLRTATEPWIEYRTDGDAPWREQEFDTAAQAEAWAYKHLGVDVVDVSVVHIPEVIELYPGIVVKHRRLDG